MERKPNFSFSYSFNLNTLEIYAFSTHFFYAPTFFYPSSFFSTSLFIQTKHTSLIFSNTSFNVFLLLAAKAARDGLDSDRQVIYSQLF